MKNKGMRKTIGLALVFIMLCSIPVFAEEETALLPEGQSVSYKLEAADPRSFLIASRVASIANNEDGTLSVYGQIISYASLDYASITLYLARYDAELDAWINISYQDAEFTVEEYGKDFMEVPTASYTLTGTEIIPGYYYRIRGTFIAKKDGRRESTNATTDGVLLTDIK